MDAPKVMYDVSLSGTGIQELQILGPFLKQGTYLHCIKVEPDAYYLHCTLPLGIGPVPNAVVNIAIPHQYVNFYVSAALESQVGFDKPMEYFRDLSRTDSPNT